MGRSSGVAILCPVTLYTKIIIKKLLVAPIYPQVAIKFVLKHIK